MDTVDAFLRVSQTAASRVERGQALPVFLIPGDIHFTPVPVSVSQVQQPSGIFLRGPFSEVQNSSKS